MRRRMSVIASGGMRVDSPRALPETEMYDAAQGKKKVQLQVGSMALQVFKGGKPQSSFLYANLKAWGADEETEPPTLLLGLRPEGGEEEGETLEFRTEQAKAIVDQVTAIAVQLAAAK